MAKENKRFIYISKSHVPMIRERAKAIPNDPDIKRMLKSIDKQMNNEKNSEKKFIKIGRKSAMKIAEMLDRMMSAFSHCEVPKEKIFLTLDAEDMVTIRYALKKLTFTGELHEGDTIKLLDKLNQNSPKVDISSHKNSILGLLDSVMDEKPDSLLKEIYKETGYEELYRIA